ncbi:MAG: ATP-binding protein [Devosia sp.]
MLAVAFTALFAATLFVITDFLRTGDEVRRHNFLVGKLSTAQPMLARQFATGSGELSVAALDGAEALTGVVQRGAGAYALALVLIVASYRRRRSPDSTSEQIADLLSSVPFGIACWTTSGRLIVCNQSYRARLGVAETELPAGAAYKSSVLRLVEGGQMRLIAEDDNSRVLELRKADGTCLMIDERPLGGGGFMTLLTDITDRRRTDTELSAIREEQRVLARRYHEEKLKAEAASRSKTSFLAHLSHDIRTPLNHIIGFADLMRHQTYGPLGDERYETYVESIKSSGDRLLSFFASILDLAELEGGQRVMNQTELGVDDLLEGVARRYAAQAKRAGLALSLGAPCGALINGDRFSLERMLGNLVENAVHFTQAGGRISVAAYAGSDGVVLEVTDTGIGMSAEKVSALSQPFAFSDASLTKDREGAGLGLAIARTIVELSGGNLVVDSRPGLGTTVAVTLPLHGETQRLHHAA